VLSTVGKLDATKDGAGGGAPGTLDATGGTGTGATDVFAPTLCGIQPTDEPIPMDEPPPNVFLGTPTDAAMGPVRGLAKYGLPSLGGRLLASNPAETESGPFSSCIHRGSRLAKTTPSPFAMTLLLSL
jgi:hypothetical protein